MVQEGRLILLMDFARMEGFNLLPGPVDEVIRLAQSSALLVRYLLFSD